MGDVRYNPAITGLRAVAIIPVIAMHSKVPGFSGGSFGVDLFFVLSGYLITSILVEEIKSYGRVDLLHFYRNRFLRLTPPLYAMLAMMLALGIAAPEQVLVAALYLGDIVIPFNPTGPVAHSWSLAVEEHFYLIWPILLAPLLRKEHPARWVFGLFAAACVWRYASYEVFSDPKFSYHRFDSRLAGAAAWRSRGDAHADGPMRSISGTSRSPMCCGKPRRGP
ncbi:acyltransferase family protein [Arvimicrobium flavum]|uniref:acyltransferase family protein n=1 Tax=Arvimicrobium flavum TaxID=3393320 RepID=UPI00237A40DF|nr:acyltransferase [Mesorhizobium shangrilense]